MTKLYAGIDIGSLTTKAVIVDQNEEVLSSHVVFTGYKGVEAAQEALDLAIKRAGYQREQIQGIVATGYGRHILNFAQKAITEITCHAIGAMRYFPYVRTVLDIGGQDSKAIGIDPELKRVINFRMNDKCAAGTGRFLEVMAERLRLDINQMIELALEATRAFEISNVCTVFAETEVVSMVAQGKPIAEILRGLHQAVINRVYPMLKDVGIKTDVVMTGGVAKNKAIVKLLEEKIKVPVHVPPDPQITGALGAALIAARSIS